MNIFYLDHNVEQCAKYHTDKHVVKMILEYAQLLSTAHRVLDGQKVDKQYVLDDWREDALYKATHVNHPSAIWTRESSANYEWLVNMLYALCSEYGYRYGKVHKVESSGLSFMLKSLPTNIGRSKIFTQPTPAMPDEFIVPGNSIQSYKNYYIGAKQHLHSWKNREVPEFIV